MWIVLTMELGGVWFEIWVDRMDMFTWWDSSVRCSGIMRS